MAWQGAGPSRKEGMVQAYGSVEETGKEGQVSKNPCKALQPHPSLTGAGMVGTKEFAARCFSSAD